MRRQPDANGAVREDRGADDERCPHLLPLDAGGHVAVSRRVVVEEGDLGIRHRGSDEQAPFSAVLDDDEEARGLPDTGARVFDRQTAVAPDPAPGRDHAASRVGGRHPVARSALELEGDLDVL